MKKIFTSIMAIAALVSCNQDNINDNTSVEGTSRFPLLQAEVDQTKTILDGTQVKFQKGDCISVFNGIVSETDHHGHCKYQCISVEGGVATFEWMAGMDETKNPAVPFNEYEPAGDVDIVATYPNRSAATSAFEPAGEAYGEGTVMIRMPATGTASGDDPFVSTSLPIIACAPQGEMLKFKHTCGLLELTMKGTATIKKVQMASEKVISGNASVEYASDEPVLTVVGTGNASSDTKITYTYTDGVALTAEGTKLYFGLPVGTHDLTFTFTDTDGNSMVKTAKGLKIDRAVITPSELEYAPAVAEVTDLSANGSYANCYVVQAAGSYCFDAKKPNGEAVTGASATWVWASGEICKEATTLPATMMTKIGYSAGKITFTIPENYNPGNVVVGVVNADGELEYTWHVWLTTAGMQDITVGNVTVMDRNLGATHLYDVTVAANAPLQGGKGNFYQWGRKDPFPGGRNSVSAEGTDGVGERTAFGTTNSQYNVINSSADIANVSQWEWNQTFESTTAEMGAKFPLRMGASKNVPGYDANSKATWCERQNANPCPYGYRVINATEFETLIEAGVETSYYNNFGQFKLGGNVLFPRAGYRHGKTGQANAGQTRARYYLNDLGTGSSNQQGAEYQFTWTSATVYSKYTKYTNTNAYNALSVRCVKVAK